MTCENCFKDNVEAFEKTSCQFKSRRPLVIFLLNIVLNIKDLWGRYCFCVKKVGVLPCSICQFRVVYLNDEYNIYENSFDLNFLSVFHQHIYKNLKCLLLETDSHIACRLINKQYFYIHKDWFNGSQEQFYLPYCLDIYENRKMNKIKNKDFKVVLDPITLKKYF